MANADVAEAVEHTLIGEDAGAGSKNSGAVERKSASLSKYSGSRTGIHSLRIARFVTRTPKTEEGNDVTTIDRSEPVDVVDRLLWRDAQLMLDRHTETEPGGQCVYPSTETVYNHSYPLSRYIYVFVNKKPGQPLEPKVKEFLKAILSREGQQQVANDHVYLPLTPEIVREELAKLDQP